jgi:hypothetical protein
MMSKIAFALAMLMAITALPRLTVLTRQYAPQAMRALVKVALTGKRAAASAILDRAFGRPSQTLRAQNENPDVLYTISDNPLSAEEWEAKYCSQN